MDGGTKAGEKPVFAFVLCLLSFVLPAAAAPEFAVTPYLQRPAADAMTIVFFTTKPCEATVEAWLANAAGTPRLQEVTTGVWAEALTNNVNCGESSVWNNSLYKHSVRLTGLEANRSYDYTVTLVGGASYSNTFRTAPSRNTPIRFVSYADCETAPVGSFSYKQSWQDNYKANLARMVTRQPDFFALSGDYAARGGVQSHWDEFWKQNAGGNGIGYGDPAGSIPILAVIGNHDLFDQGSHTSGYWYDMQGEPSTDRYVSYFGSELYYREDYGPVTLIFLDTNNGRDGDTDDDHDHDTNYLDREDGQHLQGGLDRRKGCRHPDFNVGTPQYDWLTNNLADAQAKSRFTFVFNHHCPYSRGAHNMDWREHEDGSALALRFLTETFVRYGVDGWYCGHDELLEHSITNGWEILPNGQRRKHTLSIYDLGCSGDKPRDSNKCTNPLEYWWNEDNYGGASGTKYGFLETDVTTNRNGQWTCTITPVQGSSGNYLNAQIVYVENPDRGEDENDLVYAEAANASHPIDGASQTKPSDWLPWTKPPEGPGSAPTNLRPTTDEANPIPLLSKELHGYFYDLTIDQREKVMENPSSIAGYENLTTNTFSVGTPVTLEWEGTRGECTVTVKRIGAVEAFYTNTVSGSSVEVVNLEIGAGYEWSVTEKASGATSSACLWTSNEAPRLIKSGTMKLMRDLGGWKGLDGCIVRQNLLFRGGPANNGATVDAAARNFFFNVIGLKTEIDFRSASEAKEQGTPVQFDPEGKHVTYYQQEIDLYKLPLYNKYNATKYNNFTNTIKKLMNIGGTYRPAYFHCKVGRDRTGTMAALILALLGVSEEDIWRDYTGSYTNGKTDHYKEFRPYLEEIKSYDKENGSLTEGARQYCLTVAEITDEQIETFRKEMLIGYGEPPVPPEPDWWIEEPVWTLATRVTFAAGESTEEQQYKGFLTRKGFQYAWGTNGVAATGWVTADGTPCGLEKPKGDAKWELMVRE